jgi:hypothetical protein
MWEQLIVGAIVLAACGYGIFTLWRAFGSSSHSGCSSCSGCSKPRESESSSLPFVDSRAAQPPAKPGR